MAALRPGAGGEGAQTFPFILSTGAICATAAYFAVTFRDRHPPNATDVWFYCLASTLPTAALLGLAIRVYREGGATGRPGFYTVSGVLKDAPGREEAGRA